MGVWEGGPPRPEARAQARRGRAAAAQALPPRAVVAELLGPAARGRGRTLAEPWQNPGACGAQVVVAGSLDTFQVYVWAVRTARLLDALAGHEGPVVALAFSPAQPLLASASWDRTVRTWDVFRRGPGGRLHPQTSSGVWPAIKMIPMRNWLDAHSDYVVDVLATCRYPPWR